MKRLANVIMLLVSVVAAFSLTSCELNSVAKQMSGTWTGKSLITNDDQSKEHRNIYFKFDYDEKSGKEGGTYIEVRDVNVEGYETPAGDNINITYTSYVEGIWAITENGELAMKPDLNTLKVVVSPNYKEIEQDIFSDLHTEYSLLYDKNVPFTDLQVDGDNLSFVSNTDEKISLHRTDTDIKSIYRPSTEPSRRIFSSSDVIDDEDTGDEASTNDAYDDGEVDPSVSSDESSDGSFGEDI